MESWLTDTSPKGLYFCEKGEVFACFSKDPPGAVRYRLDAISSLSPVPNQERYAGLRKGQALALTCNDIDAENEIICITKPVIININCGYGNETDKRLSYLRLTIVE